MLLDPAGAFPSLQTKQTSPVDAPDALLPAWSALVVLIVALPCLQSMQPLPYCRTCPFLSKSFNRLSLTISHAGSLGPRI